jgi:hypothetical protein
MHRFACDSAQVTLVLLAPLVAGCAQGRSADYGQLDLIDVSGRITLDGVPLNNARVEFENEDLTTSYGVTNRLGEYRLMFNSEQSGCLPGRKTVRIRMNASAAELEDPDAVVTEGVMIPAAYNNQSKLSATVTPTDREFHFELETAVEQGSP